MQIPKGASQHAPAQLSRASNPHVQSPLHHHPGQEDESHDNNINNIIHTLLHELKFEAMVGSANEPLPRLQNLQADYVNDSECDTSSDDNIATTVVPVYRYPGNYSGIEFPTHWHYVHYTSNI